MLLISLELLDFGIIGLVLALLLGLLFLAKKYTWSKILTEIEEAVIDIEEMYNSMPGKEKLEAAIDEVIVRLAARSWIFKVLEKTLIKLDINVLIDLIQEIVAKLNKFAKQKEQV